MKPRIHIIGGPGSGKTFLAGVLSQRLDVPAYDLDELFWDRAGGRYGARAETKQRNAQLCNLTAQDGWIIEGVYYEWVGPSFAAADVIIALTPSIWLRHWRVIRRFILRKSRTVASKHETIGDLWRLLRWSHRYDRANLKKAREMIAGSGRTLAECKNLAEALEAVKSAQRQGTRP